MDVHEIRKRVIPVVLVVAVAGAAWWWWSSRPTVGGGVERLGGSGTIEAEQVALTPQVAGRIVELSAEEGAVLRAGDVLYRLDDSLLALAVDQAKAGVDAASANYKHVKSDDDSNKAEKAAAKAQYDQAKTALKIARVQLGYAEVVVPLDGVLTSVAQRPGENAVPGTTMAMVSDNDTLTITIYVPESRIGQVSTGQRGTLTTDSTSDSYDVRVVYIATQPEFAPSTLETKDQRVKLVYQVKLSVEDGDGALKPGMPADVVLEEPGQR